MTSKLKLGREFRPVLKVLSYGKRLRGTPLDPFGLAKVRRIERALVTDYQQVVDALAEGLDAASFDTAVAVADAAELVRGYEDVKLRNVARYAERRAELALPLASSVTRLLSTN
jgi:indolepyruvate ferredoxin oxidoreductase